MASLLTSDEARFSQMGTPGPNSQARPSGADPNLDSLHEWLMLGAREKARSVTILTAGLPVRTVLEIGCGTGAVLEQLDQAGFADRYYAAEPSTDLYRYLLARGAITRLAPGDADNATIAESRLSGEHYDLCILSHVLEHVDEPATLLADALALSDYLLVEVPIGGTWIGNLRAKVKTAITRVPRHNNAAGHAQFFSRNDMHRLAEWCGGEVVRSRAYVPYDQMRKATQTGSLHRRAYARLLWSLSHLIGERIWAHSYYCHYALLIRRKNSIPAGERSNWNKSYFDGR
jgi:SAM-dependent methyltransferase